MPGTILMLNKLFQKNNKWISEWINRKEGRKERREKGRERVWKEERKNMCPLAQEEYKNLIPLVLGIWG